MKKWVGRIFSLFQINETLTKEARQETILRFAVWFAILVVIVLFPFRLRDWIDSPSSLNFFYLVNTSACGVLLFLVCYLNSTHHLKLAAALYLILIYYYCFSAYPLENPDRVLLYLTIPTLITSFISKESHSLLFSSLSIAGYIFIYKSIFPTIPYPIFSTICLLLIAVLSWRVSLIITQMVNQLVCAYDKTIEGWSQALELRDRETEGHSRRVTELTMNLVRKMGIEESRWIHIRRGVLLHDIGKMGIPDSILSKTGPLDESEHMIMRKHPAYGRNMLKGIPYLKSALQIPYLHHEKWDGTGYPCGLAGEEIPLEVRIFSIIDVWDAMRSTRSYRGAIPEQQVIEYINSESGRSFDPKVVDAFNEMMGIGVPDGTTLARIQFSVESQKANL